MDTHHLTDDEHRIFVEGGKAAIRFRADPHRDLSQDVLKAETAAYKLHLGYDDVTGEYPLAVTFKHPARDRHAEVSFTSHADALARAMRFITEHAAPQPRCFVDY